MRRLRCLLFSERDCVQIYLDQMRLVLGHRLLQRVAQLLLAQRQAVLQERTQ